MLRPVISSSLHKGNRESHLAIRIVNVGHREAEITGIGWKIRLLKKQHAQQITIQDGISSALPVRLRDGEEPKYYFPLEDDSRWLKDFLENFLMYYSKSRLKSLKVIVFTSVGMTFEARIEEGLRNKLVEYMQRLGHQKFWKKS